MACGAGVFFEKNDGTFAQAGAATHGFYLVV
jgi:hypothetical protein